MFHSAFYNFVFILLKYIAPFVCVNPYSFYLSRPHFTFVLFVLILQESPQNSHIKWPKHIAVMKILKQINKLVVLSKLFITFRWLPKPFQVTNVNGIAETRDWRVQHRSYPPRKQATLQNWDSSSYLEHGPTQNTLTGCWIKSNVIEYTIISWMFWSFQFRVFFMTSDAFPVPTECTVSSIYIYMMRNSYMFRCLCTIIREKNYASYLQ